MPSPAAERSGIRAASVLNLIYTHNPFYAISAALVLYGLSLVFGDAEDSSGWTLLGTLAGYTVMMALAGVLVIRLGRIWEDARSILLLLLLLFLAISVTFDRLVIETPTTGVPVLLVGLAFSAGITEGVLFGTGIRLRRLYRLGYYSFLGLFFLYPLLLLALLKLGDLNEMAPISWGLYLFPVAAGAASLVLLPAIRKGTAYAEENGTPWAWPWFPWIVFGALVACAAVRSYWLTLSFYPAEGMLTPFGAYFLVPMVLALAAILLEFGLVTGRDWLRHAALALPAVAVLMGFPGRGGSHVYRHFMGLIVRTTCSPALISAAGVLAFYVYAWLRRQPLAEVGVAMGLAVVSVIGMETTGLGDLVAPQIAPLVAIAVVETVQLVRYGGSWRAGLLLCGVAVALTSGLRATWFSGTGGIVPLHLAYAGALVVGACFKDRFARFLQSAGALVLAAVFLAALFLPGRLFPASPAWSRATYLVAVFALAPLYWLMVKNVHYMRVLLVNSTAGAAYLLGGGYVLASRGWRKRGATLIFWGCVSFVAAALISVLKTGALRRFTDRIRELAGLDAVGAWVRRNVARIVALIVLSGLFAGLVIPASGGSRTRARRTKCASNLKQVGYGLHLYAADHSERFTESLPVLYREKYISDHKVSICPRAKRRPEPFGAGPGEGFTEDHMSYCYVRGLTANDSAEYAVAFDEEWNHDGHGLNVLFVGGNVEWRRDIKAFREKLNGQLAQLRAADREVKVLRSSWSRYPELPHPHLRLASSWVDSRGYVAASAGVVLALDMGLLAAYLAGRKRRRGPR